MAVSANTLFHFTKSQSLKAILTSQGFFPQYSDEHFENILPDKSIYKICFTPLISFCDLTIMQLSVDSLHRENYGEYGLGLTKEWGIRNGVSPVIYVHEKSQPSTQLYNFIKLFRMYGRDKENDEVITKVRRELVDSFKFIKPYKGRWHKGERIPKNKPDIIYYNEREWRYCPTAIDFGILSGIKSNNKNRKDKYNQQLRKRLIKFKASDVKFILIKNKNEITEFVNEIDKMGITIKEKNELITKIMTFEEIKEDF